MKAFGHLSEQIETFENFADADYNASRRKGKRKEVKDFRANLHENLMHLLSLYREDRYKPAPYSYKTIFEPKERFLSMLPYPDHVFHWAMLLQSEPIINRMIDAHSYACIKGRGQHQMIAQISKDIYLAGDDIRYYLSLDVSKMYASIPIAVPKAFLRRKIKDPRLLRHFDTIIDSSIGTPMGNNSRGEQTGIPIGLKISTLLANISLGYLDHDCRRCFGVAGNEALADMLAGQYISEKFLSARTTEDMAELEKGVQYLTEQFRRYIAEPIRYYYRFMDNIVILHRDKTFLHLLLDWIGLYMAHELRLDLNPKWQVGSLIDGLTIVGYRIFADSHIRANRQVKTKLVKQILRGRKMGLTDDQIRRAVSSRLGCIKHANSINLLRKYNMETRKERLGAKINKRKSQCPFDGVTHAQQRRFEHLLFDPETGGDENNRMMELTDFAVIDSTKEFYDDGKPKPCLAIRYVWQGETVEYTDDKGKTVLIEKDKEYYSYTGSRVLIEQVQTEFSKEDLPAPTVIQIAVNKRNKKFYKFT